MKPLRIWLVGTGTVGTWLVEGVGEGPRQRDFPALWLDNVVVPVLRARPGHEEGLT